MGIKVNSQSPYGNRFEFCLDAGLYNVRLLKERAGNFTKYTTAPAGEWFGFELNYSGRVEVSKYSKNDVVFALADKGAWSGGSNYEGYVFGKVGAVVRLRCKSTTEWIIFEEDGPRLSCLPPVSKQIEL